MGPLPLTNSLYLLGFQSPVPFPPLPLDDVGLLCQPNLQLGKSDDIRLMSLGHMVIW